MIFQDLTLLVRYVVMNLILAVGFLSNGWCADKTGDSIAKAVALFSYHPGFWVVEDENKGLVQGLAEVGYIEGENIIIHRFYMDTKRANKSVEAQEAAAAAVLKEIERIGPDILFSYDDDALRHIGGKLLDTDLPIVFGGVNQLPTMPNYAWKKDGSFTALVDSLERPGHNITGVQEKIHLKAGFQLLHRIVPEAKTALFLSDNSYSATEFLKIGGGEAALENTSITVVKKVYTDSFETIQKLVLDYQDKVDCIVMFLPWTMEDKDGNHVPQFQVVRWLLQNNKRPGIAYLDILAEEGFLCGVVVDMVKQGFYSGLVGGRILGGENPADMPVLDPVANRIMINLARAKQLGIDIPFEVIEDADVILKEMTAYPEFTTAK